MPFVGVGFVVVDVVVVVVDVGGIPQLDSTQYAFPTIKLHWVLVEGFCSESQF
jgi:hypothetical protein